MIMADSRTDSGDEATRLTLPILAKVRLMELLRSDNPRIAEAARRVHRDGEHSGENYAAFANTP
jgi:hypothetical protein